MPAAGERGRKPHGHDFVRQRVRHDARTDSQHVGIVVLARQARRIEIVAQRGAHAGNLVGGHLFPLAAPADHDAAVGPAVDHVPRYVGANRRVINNGIAVSAAVVGHVSETLERRDEMLLQREACMIRADGDAHGMRLYKGAKGAMGAMGAMGARGAMSAKGPMSAGTPVMSTVTIKHRGEERVRSGHPWIYKSDVAKIDARGGDTVRVIGARGRVLGHALFSDRSEIALRFITHDAAAVDASLWRRRLSQAVQFRQGLDLNADAYRLVHGEADLLPSLIVDRYADYLVLQALSQGMDRLVPELTSILVDLVGPAGILARNDPRVRLLEGLEQRVEVLYGTVPDQIEVREGSVSYLVDPYRGQKTGLFLDQRENRIAAAKYARGRLLDAFSYNGGFALALAPKCDEVIAIDISDDAVARIAANALRNGASNVHARAMNVFDELRELERRGERFDTIVLDPPAFAKNKASVAKALSGYKEINLRALKILSPGGFLITCSCSYNVSEGDFADLLAAAAADAHAAISVVEKRMQGRDHPVLITVPETFYLKCFILRKLD
jgi:23S rRNA (cytosine1962-C5)-methyltransferase